MALRAVIDHPKFAELKARLGTGKGRTLGYLEALWHFTGRFTPQGNVGKYSDLQIEAWIEWEGEPGALIKALADSHWIDADETHRYLVHDWQEHADHTTKVALKRAGLEFFVPRVFAQCSHSVPTVFAPPVPEPVPVPDTPPISPPPGDGIVPLPKAEKPKRDAPMKVPTQEDVAHYFREKMADGYDKELARRFWNFYASKGWKVGRNPMKEWHYAANNWIADSHPPDKPTNGHAPPNLPIRSTEEARMATR